MFASRLGIDGRVEAAGLLYNEGEVVDEVRERSATINQALRYVMYVYAEHAKRTLTNSTLDREPAG